MQAPFLLPSPIVGHNKWKDQEMHLNEFYTMMSNLDPSSRAEVLAKIKGDQPSQDRHVQWLADWHAARDAACEANDNSKDETKYHDMAEALSVQLATIPATTLTGAMAQIAWFKEDLGQYVIGNRMPEQDRIFDTLSKTLQNIGG
jgi:hypothetical protein